MENKTERRINLRVEYVDDHPERAEAALEILRQGFWRGLLKLKAEQVNKSKKDGMA